MKKRQIAEPIQSESEDETSFSAHDTTVVDAHGQSRSYGKLPASLVEGIFSGVLEQELAATAKCR